jgi:hypothetical protein
MLYLICRRIAGAAPTWFNNKAPRYSAERMADKLFTATWRADVGRRDHSADCTRIALMASMLRSDYTPAQAILYLENKE